MYGKKIIHILINNNKSANNPRFTPLLISDLRHRLPPLRLRQVHSGVPHLAGHRRRRARTPAARSLPPRTRDTRAAGPAAAEDVSLFSRGPSLSVPRVRRHGAHLRRQLGRRAVQAEVLPGRRHDLDYGGEEAARGQRSPWLPGAEADEGAEELEGFAQGLPGRVHGEVLRGCERVLFAGGSEGEVNGVWDKK